MSLSLVFDLLLCLGLILLAWNAIASRGQFRATVMFMVFGLLMAGAWARLQAPDLALAEAAIGAGLTGALLLNACKASYTRGQDRAPASQDRSLSPAGRAIAALFCALSGAGLAWLMIGLPGAGGPVPSMVSEAQPEHFLDNPVTSVLLDYRAYDTLLEMAVLLLAVIGARILLHQRSLPALFPPREDDPPMVRPLLQVATPLLLLTALYLLWAGSHSPGGAFQSGALLAALGVMYRLSGRLSPTPESHYSLRLLLVLGLGLFSVFACLGVLWAELPLSYPDSARYALVLLIETGLMLSIAATLVLMFSASGGLQLERRL